MDWICVEGASDCWTKAGVIVQIFVAIVAVFMPTVVMRWWRNRHGPLVSFELHEPNGHKTFDTDKNGNNPVEVWYYLLRVKNRRNSPEAKNVRVRVLEIGVEGPDDKYRTELKTPLYLVWSLQADPDKPTRYSSITTFDDITIGHISEKTFIADTRPFVFNVDIIPNYFTNFFQPGYDITVKLEVSGSNCVSSTLATLKIKWVDYSEYETQDWPPKIKMELLD